MQRRAFYMRGLAASLRLPSGPVLASQEPEAGDGVLLRLLAIRKGRALLARTLSLLAPPKVATYPEPCPVCSTAHLSNRSQCPCRHLVSGCPARSVSRAICFS